jgi:hypothetical protein
MLRRGRRRKQLLDDLKELEDTGSLKRTHTILNYVGNSLRNRLQICPNTDYGMSELLAVWREKRVAVRISVCVMFSLLWSGINQNWNRSIYYISIPHRQI